MYAEHERLLAHHECASDTDACNATFACGRPAQITQRCVHIGMRVIAGNQTGYAISGMQHKRIVGTSQHCTRVSATMDKLQVAKHRRT